MDTILYSIHVQGIMDKSQTIIQSARSVYEALNIVKDRYNVPLSKCYLKNRKTSSFYVLREGHLVRTKLYFDDVANL